MPNSAMISFKLEPDHYAVVKAMATSQGKSISEFVRETVESALDLDLVSRRFAAFIARAAEELE